jgi:hypothetical protein
MVGLLWPMLPLLYNCFIFQFVCLFSFNILGFIRLYLLFSITFVYFIFRIFFNQYVCLFSVNILGFICYFPVPFVILFLDYLIIYLSIRYFWQTFIWLGFYSQCFLFYIIDFNSISMPILRSQALSILFSYLL